MTGYMRIDLGALFPFYYLKRDTRRYAKWFTTWYGHPAREERRRVTPPWLFVPAVHEYPCKNRRRFPPRIKMTASFPFP